MPSRPLGLDIPDARQASRVPLAHRLRPRSLDEVEGHEELLSSHGWLRAALEEGRAVSCIFWGPPGVGKTTLAGLMAERAGLPMTSLSAVAAGKREVQTLIDRARREQRSHILFLDEIHRFNKAQQDVLLPALEDGSLLLIGATTENPSFSINNALLSRCRVVVLQALSQEAVMRVLRRACATMEAFCIDDEALEWMARMADGDARYALNALQELWEVDARKHWSLADVRRQWSRKQMAHDRQGDAHYDLISALHKSVRDSDADAACYWLARMLEAGDDPLYLARRLLRMASEDVGLADPKALEVCVAALRMYEVLGSPEGEQGLFEAAVYLALAPKSNALYQAEKAARKLARETASMPVPVHLRNAPTALMRALGHGRAYRYAHDEPDAIVDQAHFPDDMADDPPRLYRPVERGFERTLSQRIDWIEQRKKRA